MCGRYASFSSSGQLALDFSLDGLSERAEKWAPSWNVAPTQPIRIIVDAEGAREAHVARWGLVPPWAKNPGAGPNLINARMETAATKRSFAPALAERRCIVPADWYYEWKAGTAPKTPYRIGDGAPLAFAGLFQWFRDEDHAWRLSATILTRQATGPLAEIHHRMPVLLEPEAYGAWLARDAVDPQAALDLISRPGRELQAVEVSRAVSNVRSNGPQLCEPVADPAR